MKSDVWPDARLEGFMLEDAELILSDCEPTSAGHETACHVKALLQRVRELERRVAEQEKPPLTFTRNQPIESGWYFHLCPLDHEPAIIKAEMLLYEGRACPHVQVQSGFMPLALLGREYQDCLWAGPVPVPPIPVNQRR